MTNEASQPEERADQTDRTDRTNRKNLWAPWRMEYIRSLAEPDDGCFLCRCRDETENDDANLVVWRGRRTLAVLNRFPYTGGHCLVAPYEHVPDLTDLPTETLTEIMEMLRDLQQAMTRALKPDGFNVGINLGRCAGAGLPGHIHAHIVPRWEGDTNFMPVFGRVHVVPEFLENILAEVRRAGEAMGLPKLSEPI
ncbi:MAG: HIT domain-containing protein [Phycisphaerae bacterium]|nr:HIT domain-containing protein [Phycisphaerae bacterium]